MGDWQDFCDAFGMPYDWEPWNEPGWADDSLSPLPAKDRLKLKSTLNFKNLLLVIKNMINALRVKNVKISSTSSFSIELNFLDSSFILIYTYSYYKDGRNFDTLKEDILVLLLLYKSKIDVVRLFGIKLKTNIDNQMCFDYDIKFEKNYNLHFSEQISLNQACSIYLKNINAHS